MIDDVISPNMTDREAMELAYGLLWMVGCDRSNKNGEALYLARKAIYERLNRDGQARGITAARAATNGRGYHDCVECSDGKRECTCGGPIAPTELSR